MQDALRHADALSADLESHPLYAWIASSRHVDARRHYDNFVPILGFIMAFPYYNERFLNYLCSEASDGELMEGAAHDAEAMQALKTSINHHAQEDCTHARLFLHDFEALDLAEVWGIEWPSTLLWTVWLSPRFDAALAAQSRRLKALLRTSDAWPPMRYLHVEQLEGDGHLLFSAATAKAAQVQAQRGVDPVYFGMHHLGRETGHVGASRVEEITLSTAHGAHARALLDELHAVSLTMNDEMHRFARDAEALAAAGSLMVREQQDRLAWVRAKIAAHRAGEVALPDWHIRPASDSPNADLVLAWERHHAAFSRHPFAKLFAQAEGEDVGFAMRCALLLFANRICSLHAFYKFDCRVDESNGPGADVVRFIGKTFATEAELFFHDWDVLGMDLRIPWSTARLLEWWFLDRRYGRPEMEALHEFRRQALRQAHDPLVTYWTILSVHFMSRAFFAASGPLTERYARANPADAPLTQLPQLAGRFCGLSMG